MSMGTVAFLLGLFGVPLALLVAAHKLRRRSDRAQRAFWGAAIGHCVAAVLARCPPALNPMTPTRFGSMP